MSDEAETEAREAQIAALLTAAEEQVGRLEAAPNASDRPARLLQASFLTQLAAAFLLEPALPTGPKGLEQRRDRQRARRAVPFLLARHERRTRALAQKVPDLAPSPPRAVPRTEADQQLAAQTAATLQELREARLDLLREHLDFTRRDEVGSRSPAVQEAALSLLVGYWHSQRRLLRIKREHPSKLIHRPKPNITAELHRPTWQNEVSREFWRSLNPDFLFWSDPLPVADSTPLSQEL